MSGVRTETQATTSEVGYSPDSEAFEFTEGDVLADTRARDSITERDILLPDRRAVAETFDRVGLVAEPNQIDARSGVEVERESGSNELVFVYNDARIGIYNPDTGLRVIPSVTSASFNESTLVQLQSGERRIVSCPNYGEIGVFDPDAETYSGVSISVSSGDYLNADTATRLDGTQVVVFTPLDADGVGVYDAEAGTFTEVALGTTIGNKFNDNATVVATLSSGEQRVVFTPRNVDFVGAYNPETGAVSTSASVDGTWDLDSAAEVTLQNGESRVVLAPGDDTTPIVVYNPENDTVSQGPMPGSSDGFGNIVAAMLQSGEQRAVLVPRGTEVGVYNPETDSYQGLAHNEGLTSPVFRNGVEAQYESAEPRVVLSPSESDNVGVVDFAGGAPSYSGVPHDQQSARAFGHSAPPIIDITQDRLVVLVPDDGDSVGLFDVDELTYSSRSLADLIDLSKAALSEAYVLTVRSGDGNTEGIIANINTLFNATGDPVPAVSVTNLASQFLLRNTSTGVVEGVRYDTLSRFVDLNAEEISDQAADVLVTTDLETAQVIQDPDFGFRYEGQGAVTIGSRAGDVGVGSIVLAGNEGDFAGPNIAESPNSVAIGGGNTITGSTAAFVTGNSNSVDGSGWDFVGGFGNEIKVDDNAVLHVNTNVVLGFSNSVLNSNSALVAGASNIAQGERGAQASIISGFENTVEDADNCFVSGKGNTPTRVNFTVVSGFENDVTGSDGAIIVGARNTVNGTGDPAGNFSLIAGDNVTVNDGYASVISGRLTQFDGRYGAMFGQSNTGDGNHIFAAGRGNSVTAGFAASLGRSNEVSGTTAMAFGRSLIAGTSDLAAFGRFNEDLTVSPLVPLMQVGVGDGNDPLQGGMGRVDGLLVTETSGVFADRAVTVRRFTGDVNPSTGERARETVFTADGLGISYTGLTQHELVRVSSDQTTTGAGFYSCNTSSGAVTLTIRTEDARDGAEVNAKLNGAGELTVAAEGATTIDDGAYATLTQDNEAFTLIYNAAADDWELY